MEKTDPDYNEKVQKFLNCRRIIDEKKCPEDCDVCEFDIGTDEFVQLLVLNIDENLE